MGAAMAPGIRHPQPGLTVRHSFQPSRLRDQLLATAYRLVNAAALLDFRQDATADHTADRRPALGKHGATFSGGHHHE
jgi:hypothetical protein